MPASAATSTSVLWSPSTDAAAMKSRAACGSAASLDWITSARDLGARQDPWMAVSASSVSSASSARASRGLPPVYRRSLRKVRPDSSVRPRTPAEHAEFVHVESVEREPGGAAIAAHEALPPLAELRHPAGSAGEDHEHTIGA